MDLAERLQRNSLGNAEKLVRERAGLFDKAEPPASTQPQSMFRQFVGEAAAPAGNMAMFLTGKGPGGQWVASPEARAALEQARSIAAKHASRNFQTRSSGIQAVHDAWRAGGPEHGGWMQIPVFIKEGGEPVWRWVRWRPTFDESKGFMKQEAMNPHLQNQAVFKEGDTIAQGRSGDLFHFNPEVMRELPNIGDVPTRVYWSRNQQGQNTMPVMGYTEDIQIGGPTARDLRHTAAHEFAHKGQFEKGWGTGSSESNELALAAQKGPQHKITRPQAFKRYQNDIGEINAELDAKLHLNQQMIMPAAPDRGGKYAWQNPRDVPASLQYEKPVSQMGNSMGQYLLRNGWLPGPAP